MDNRKVHLIGNAHLDPVWLWRWGEGANEVLQTFRSALDRLNEYPGFIFTCSSARYYKWVEEADPAMFEEIRARVQEGRWLPVGGWAVQPDCNMPSGESFARHALYSQLYYYEKFGKICRVGYNVDSFGHAGSLPKLLGGGGMFSYVFQRPGPHENPEIPAGAFQWKGDDGSRVLAWHIPESYTCSGTDALDRRTAALTAASDEKGYPMMLFFGVGNHGGGPTKGDIEHLIRTYRADDANADAVFGEPDTYFRELALAMPDLPVFSGELQHHASGCYSAMSRVKALNRRAENALYAAEVWDTAAARITGRAPQTAKLAGAWEQVLFCQFHDSLCGCSVREAYDDIEVFFGHAISVAEQIRTMALLRLAERIDTRTDGIGDTVTRRERHLGAPTGSPRPVVVFNPLSVPVKKAVRVGYAASAVTDDAGNAVAFQLVRSSRSNDSHTDTIFEAEIPAAGYRLYRVTDTAYDYHGRYALPEKADAPVILENDRIRVEFDHETGCIRAIADKASGKTLTGEIDAPTVVRDDRTDTWAHNVFRFDGERRRMACAGVYPVENGPVRQVVRVRHTCGNSYLVRDYILEAGQNAPEVRCRANWQEPFTVLKAVSVLDGAAPASAAAIPMGTAFRAPCGDEEPMQGWCDLTVTAGADRVGLCVLNDGKYAYDCDGTALGVTLLRNVIFADHYSDRPAADFDFTDEGLHRFCYALYFHTGALDPSDAHARAAILACAPEAVQTGYHPGSLPGCGEGVRLSAGNVLVSALKYCEDGSGDVILRLWETAGKANTLVTCMSDLFDFGFRFEIGACEVKTFRVTPGGAVREYNFLEGIPAPETDTETIADPPYGNYDQTDEA